MTTQWPSAPGLRRALERTAAEARTDTPARDQLRELLDDADREAMVSTPLLPDTAPRPRRGAMLVAAAVAMVCVGVGAVLVSVAGDDRPGQVRSSETSPASSLPSSPAPTTSPAQAQVPIGRLSAGVHCSQPDGDARPFLLEVPSGSGTLELEVGVSMRAPAQPELIVVDADTWRVTASRLAVETHLGQTTSGGPYNVYYLPSAFDPDAADEVASAMLSSTCRGAAFLFAGAAGYNAAEALACAHIPGRGFNGFGFVDPGPPPDGCSLSQPVIIVGSEPLVNRADWERHQGCAGATTTGDDEGNLITTYESCENTLIHVDTSASDPMAASIDGLPTLEYLTTVTEIAR